MTPRPQYRPLPEITPTDRAFRDDTIAAVAKLETTTANLGDRMDAGFASMEKQFFAVGETLEKLNATLTTFGGRLQSLEESRDRSRKLVKWLGGVAATVVAAIVLIVLGLK